MKLPIFIVFTVLTSIALAAENLDILGLLDRDLGESIEIKSAVEIWYCPDNTFEMYKSD